MEVNSLILVIGGPGCGKTTLTQSLVVDRLRAGHRVFVHDVANQFKSCQWYPDGAAWQAAYRAAVASKAKRFPRGAAIGSEEADEVIDLALDAGVRAGNRHTDVKAPITLVLDEAALAERSTANYLHPKDRRMLARRRHVGIEVIYLGQWPAQMHKAFFSTATLLYLFAQNPDDIPTLESRCSLPRGTLAALATAPDHRYVIVQPRKGVVSHGDISSPAVRNVEDQRAAAVPAPVLPSPPGASREPPRPPPGQPAPAR